MTGVVGEASAEALADEIDRRIRELPRAGVEPVRRIRREYSRRLRAAPAGAVLALAARVRREVRTKLETGRTRAPGA